MDDNFTLKLDESILIDGVDRAYHIQQPDETFNKPLVVLLHGHGGSSDQSLGLESSKAAQKVWLDIAKEEDFILVVPNGELGPEDSRGWNDCRDDAVGNPDTDDVGFISELLTSLHDELEYDVDRVYITGVSNGGFMTMRLAQEIPERLAAFASIIITLPENSKCEESDIPLSALFMNGTEDPIAPYDGGQISGDRGEVKSTDETIEYWIERNKVDPFPIEESFEDIDTKDNSTVDKFSYINGTNDTEVVLYRVNGGGHTEPSLEEKYSSLYLAIVGRQNHDIEMAQEVWSFFKTKTR